MKATKLLKKAIKLKKKNTFFSKRIAHILILILRYIFAFEAYVSEKTEVGEDVIFKHNGLGCVLHPSAIIKKNCWIYQNVTIGASTRYKNGKLDNTDAPIIGENTVIYAGASIVGPIKVGRNCVIGTNCVITKNIEDNMLVYGNPAIIKERKEGIEYITPKNFGK